MLSRGDVTSKYQTLAQEQLGVGHPAFDWIDQLPPALCRSLILGSDIKATSSSFNQAFTGTVNGEIAEVEGLKVSVGEFSMRLFRSLPLEGHLPLGVPGMCNWVAGALETLQQLDKGALSFVREWCALILWVAPNADNPPKTVLTSVAVPTLPHCTILSVKGLRHIPADHMYEGASTYALAENIYHEALHQQLSSSLIFGAKMMRDAETASIQPILVPWRNTSWELDRVVHAAWVYSNLQRLRKLALSMPNVFGNELGIVGAATKESESKLQYLQEALESTKAKLSISSRKVIEQVLGRENT